MRKDEIKITTIVGVAGYHFYHRQNHLLDSDTNTAPKALNDALYQVDMLPMIIALAQPATINSLGISNPLVQKC